MAARPLAVRDATQGETISTPSRTQVTGRPLRHAVRGCPEVRNGAALGGSVLRRGDGAGADSGGEQKIGSAGRGWLCKTEPPWKGDSAPVAKLPGIKRICARD